VTSPEFAQIRAAQAEGRELTLDINGYQVQYEPQVPSGMGYRAITNFDGHGFTMAGDAFTSDDEIAKALAHELYRLNYMNPAETGMGAGLAASSSDAAGDFADRIGAWVANGGK